MQHLVTLKTDRLRLRQWTENDFQPFAELCADPEVMRFFPKPLTRQQSFAFARKTISLIAENSWGFWAVEVVEQNRFIGFVGLHRPTYTLPVTNCVEIGWRLSRASWGKGYATEAAQSCLQFAFEDLQLNEVYSFTTVGNRKSRAVMERIGMRNTGNNFVHPLIDENHPLSEHVLYKIDRYEFISTSL